MTAKRKFLPLGRLILASIAPSPAVAPRVAEGVRDSERVLVHSDYLVNKHWNLD
jgi:hypothetical protein